MRGLRPKDVKKWQGQEGPPSPKCRPSLCLPSQDSLEAVSLVHIPHRHLFPGPVLVLPRGMALSVWPSVCGFRAHVSVSHHLPSLSTGSMKLQRAAGGDRANKISSFLLFPHPRARTKRLWKLPARLFLQMLNVYSLLLLVSDVPLFTSVDL